jgi:hypothetical protein
VPSKPTDAGSLRDRLTSVEQQIRIVGLGEGGLIALSFGHLTPQIADVAPHWILGALVTLLVIAGALLARAWIAVHLASGWLDNRSSAAVPNTATRFRIARHRPSSRITVRLNGMLISITGNGRGKGYLRELVKPS